MTRNEIRRLSLSLSCLLSVVGLPFCAHRRLALTLRLRRDGGLRSMLLLLLLLRGRLLLLLLLRRRLLLLLLLLLFVGGLGRKVMRSRLSVG